MAINKATIVKEVDGTIEYIYPKTTADIVEYTTDVSVKDKLDELSNSIEESVDNQEVIDARVAKSDGLTKTSLKARIDADFVALNGAITSSISDADTQFQGRLNSAVEQFEQSTEAALQAANGKNKIFHQAEAPAASVGLTIGDTWFDTNDDYKMYRWDGTQWVEELFDENAIADGAISNVKIKDATIEDAKIKWLDAGKITAGYIDSNRIKANELLSQNITATGTITGVTIDGGTIRGGNLDIGSSSQYIKYNSSTGKLDIKVTELNIGSSKAATTANVANAKQEAIAAAASDADSKISDLQSELNSNITAAIEAAQLNSDKTITSATVLYYLSNSNTTTPAAPNAHVTSVSTNAGSWTTKTPTCTSTYKYYYNCTEYLYDDNSYGWSAVTYNAELSIAAVDSYILNNLTNIGDGEVKIQNGALYVDTEFVNSLFARDITVPSNGTITGGTFIGGIIKSLNYMGASTANGIDNTAGSIIDLNNGYFNFGGGAMTFDGSALRVKSGHIGGFQIATENNAYLLRAQITDSSDVTHQYAFQAPDTEGSTSNAFYIRQKSSTDSSWTYPFRVRYDGYLKATKVDIQGKITCSSGTIGGFTISDTLLRNVTTVSLNNKTIPVFAKNGVITTGTGSGSYEARYFIQAPEGADGSTGNVFAAQYRPTANNPDNDWINLFRARYDGHVICNALRSYNGIKSYGIAYFSNFTGSGNSTAENDFITIAWRTTSDNSFDAPIIRGEVTGQAYLGSGGFRWNYLYLTNASNIASDKKLKDHVEYLADDENLEDFFYGLKPVMYKLKDSYGRRNHMGLYAQDVSENANNTIGDLAAFEAAVIDYDENGEKIELYYNPETDYDDSDLSWGLKYEEFIAPTIAIVQKQHARIVDLENENAELKDRLASIEERLAALEA